MIGMKTVRAPTMASRATVAPRFAARKPMVVCAAAKWTLSPDSAITGGAVADKPAVELTSLWENVPHRVVLAPTGKATVLIASSSSSIDPTLASFNYHGASTMSQLVQAKVDYHHDSSAHAVLVIEGVDSSNATIALQRGDRSSMQVKLNGRMLKVEKKTPLKPGDMISLPDVEYRVKAE